MIDFSKVIFLCLLSLQGLQAASLLTDKLVFDFAPQKNPAVHSCRFVFEHSFYEKGVGYGLLTRRVRSFKAETLTLQDEVSRDGLAADSLLSFQVDLEPGHYVIHLIMDGGRLGAWHGSIRFNEQLVATELLPYRLNAEGDEPPDNWFLMARVDLQKPGLTISVTARDQPTTVSGVSIYADDPGPLTMQNGQLAARMNLQGPNAALILRLLNGGRVVAAQKLIEVIPDSLFGYEKAFWLMALAGRLEIEQPRPLLEWALRLLQLERPKKPQAVAIHLHYLNTFLQADSYYKMAGWDWAVAQTQAGIFERQDFAARSWEMLVRLPQHPLYHRVLWEIGKLCYHGWVEEHEARLLARSDECFQELLSYYPQHRTLLTFLGVKFCPDQERKLQAQADVPAWALESVKAMQGLQRLLHYWVQNRQADNGEFGGKYDDDVEMLRWWPVSRLALNDSLALLGMERLVNGIWHSGWIANGFSAKVRDVEHAAEPVADTQPMMIGLDYGNPVYVERCMQSVKGLRDLWTGINQKGHRHFKSSWYSATQMDQRPPRDCDVPMNTRTVQALRWLAWYNRHPFAMQFLREWCDAWLQDCLRTDRGKPAGVVPPAIRFDDDAVSPYGDAWHQPNMFWSYYNFSGGHQMLLQFLAAYDLFHDAKYLQPVETAIRLLKQYPNAAEDTVTAGSEAWVAQRLAHSSALGEILEVWRMVTGHTHEDSLLSRFGSDYVKFVISQKPSLLAANAKGMSESLLCQGELLTVEGYFTDRIDIADHRQAKNWAAAHLESMYTGVSFNDGFYPFYPLTWYGLDEEMTALVLSAAPERMRVLVWNPFRETRPVTLALWRLQPGIYSLSQGVDADWNLEMDRVEIHESLAIAQRPFLLKTILSAGSATCIDLKRQKGFAVADEHPLPDLALGPQDIRVQAQSNSNRYTVSITVHNIGSAGARNVQVVLHSRVAKQADKILCRQMIPVLDAPLDLEPRVHTVHFKVDVDALNSGLIYATVDQRNAVQEINENNNSVPVRACDRP